MAKKMSIRKLTAPMQMPSHMEINGNQEVIVDGCGGVLEYDTDVVRIKTGKLIVRFTGRGLVIKCLTADSLVVTGYLTGIEFCV
nr:YabP/YqfC family sporulation protein [uncultured Caproiciproducens sp.]